MHAMQYEGAAREKEGECKRHEEQYAGLDPR